MASLKGYPAEPAREALSVTSRRDVRLASQAARSMALAMGFAQQRSEEIALVVSELSSNLVKHASGGTLTLTCVNSAGQIALEIEALDQGPGIRDPERALTDGFSTAGGLGLGLGTVARLVDDLDINTPVGPEGGTRIVCQQRLATRPFSSYSCPLDIGVATRSRLSMVDNGDAFIIKRWEESALVGVVDGLGHGALAKHASQTARQYVERHFQQPLKDLFLGVDRACRSTRGVVMALAQFNCSDMAVQFASIGNVEGRLLESQERTQLMARRGILGLSPPNAVVTAHRWSATSVLVLHSDGLSPRWRWESFSHLASQSAVVIAQEFLCTLARLDDDATVLVVKNSGTK